MATTVKDVIDKIQSDEVIIALFGITGEGRIKYDGLVRTLGDAILAQAKAKRGGKQPSQDTVLGPAAEKHFAALKAWTAKFH